MGPGSDWRVYNGEAYLRRLNRSGFAWEFVRRNPTYQSDYHVNMREAATVAGRRDATDEALTRRWGLCFSDRPEPVE
jgi:Family of unknown function (DUF6499)